MPQVINLALWGPYMWPLLEALTEMGLPSTEDHSGQDAGQPTTARPRFPCRSLHTFDHIPATTFRTWSKSPIAQHFLGGLTHLRLENCQMSPFIPVEHLTNITHIAVPGLHLYSQRVLYEMLDSILELETLQMLVVVLPPPPGENDDVSRVGSSIVEEYYSFQSVYFAFRTGNLTPAEWQDDIGMGAGSIWNSSIPLRKLADGSLTVEQLVANNWRA
ncbi:hypothetical protein GLOTRDRAFT_93674 [Gloeophyllum trabeum ATCC 11539]|uniref:Uncharacterized protein n=1 Tax=Gloeophyllum trabeum (strain ATCC 11539 / FP-39264 / Madison 617) TaxID=670483 RepID=S7Q6J9_GLOTA|nr:uncharacterized protein GLOTRDRAFT_93674 [Gloeophyllum trabeum ATCC 11539]EPQ55142.1 hypothetical protein GLOTRDRAFT_93674 [Gloeophyllum trabeum ATCC 11539]